MNDTPVPDRVTNKDLYVFMLKNNEERANTKEEIVGKITALELRNEARLTHMETCLEINKKDIERLKLWDKGLGIVALALGGLGIKFGS